MTQVTNSQVSEAFIQTFNTNVKIAYEGKGKLRSSVTFVGGVGGDSHKFPLMSGGTAKARGDAHSIVQTSGSSTGGVKVIFDDLVAAEYIDKFERFKVNFDLQKPYIKLITNQITRAEDQLIIDAVAANTFPTNKKVAKDVSGSTANLTIAAVKKAASLLDADEVDEEGRHFIYTNVQKEALLGLAETSDINYAGVKALVNGDINTLLGFTFHMIGANRAEGGLPKTTTVRKCFAWQEDAVGLAMAADMDTEINYVAERLSHLVTCTMSGGAGVIDKLGVIQIECDEA